MTTAGHDFLQRRHASGIIAELTRSASAAIIAALPARPGETAEATVIQQRTGLGAREFWTTVTRLADLKLVRHASGHLMLDHESITTVSQGLIADSPLVPLLDERPQLRAFVERGRVVRMPTEPKLVDELYLALAELIERDTVLTEQEINQIIAVVHDDPAEIRRGLVDRGLVERSPETQTYRRPTSDQSKQMLVESEEQ